MIRSTRRRGARWATALALTSALVLAPTAAFAADPAVSPVGADGTDADAAASSASDTAAAAAAPTEAETPAAETPATETPAAETPAVEAPAETPAAEAPATDAPAAETEDVTAEVPAASALVADGIVMNYVVNTTVRSADAVADASAAVVAAGGVVLSQYPEIGVVTAQSRDGDFLAEMRATAGVESAGPTRTAEVVGDEVEVPAEAPATSGVTAPAAGATGTGPQSLDRSLGTEVAPVDPLEAQQWDMTAIGAPEAREIEDGDGVVVGVLDSGIDVSHPDLAGQVDASKSVGCAVNGQPDQSQAAWVPVDDSESHGTHVAGTIAAADNGVGIVGIAPGATLASVKVVNYDGFIYPEYALCGFMWAADQGFDVTNNSYYVDPWEFWCSTEADQAPALTAVTRAVEFSEDQGVLSVAAAGNSSYDLANKTTNDSSPNDTTPVDRDVSEGCSDIPTEIDGVVTVSALRLGADGQPVFDSRYSNFGAGVIDLGAPGSNILSTVFGGEYEAYNGTSMASPHVAGVAALLAATHPGASPAELQVLLKQQATKRDDPALYGAGVVNAFAAVTEDLVPALGPVAAVADGTVQAGRPFRVLGANFVPGETVTVTGPDGEPLDGEFTADAEGRLVGPAVLSPFLPAGATTLELTGDAGSRATLDLLVEEAVAGPAITAPVAGSTVEAGTVTVTGTAQPGALVTVVLATADQFEGFEQMVTPTSPSARLDVAGEPVAFDTDLGFSVSTIQTEATGAFTASFTGVPAGDYGTTALQVLADGTSSTFTDPVLFSVAAAAVVPPVTVPGTGVVPVTTPAGTGVVPVTSTRAGALAYTGSEPGAPLSAALLLLVAGAGALVAARRLRRRADTRIDG